MMPRRGGSTRPRQNPRQQNSQGGKPGMGFQQLPGRPAPNLGSQGWMGKHPNGPLAQGGGGRQSPGDGYGNPSPFAPRQNWEQRGFASQDAARSVGKQYGYVKNEQGQWGRPTMDWFTRQMEQQGYGPQFQAQSMNEAGTPVSIGGARWMMGKNGLDFTGQQSDVPWGNQQAGQAYDSAQQTPYGRTRRTRTFGNVGY